MLTLIFLNAVSPSLYLYLYLSVAAPSISPAADVAAAALAAPFKSRSINASLSQSLGELNNLRFNAKQPLTIFYLLCYIESQTVIRNFIAEFFSFVFRTLRSNCQTRASQMQLLTTDRVDLWRSPSSVVASREGLEMAWH